MTQLLKSGWNNYKVLGTKGVKDGEEKAKITVMNLVSLFCGIGFFTSFLSRLALGLDGSTLISPGLSSILFFLLPIFSYLNKPKLAWHFGICAVTLAITYAGFMRPVGFANYLLFGCITYLVIFLFNHQTNLQYAYLTFIAINVFVFTWAANQGNHLPNEFPLKGSYVVVFLALLANLFIIRFSYKYRNQRVKELAYAISLKNAALNANKDATLIISEEGEIREYNTQYLKLWGLSKEIVEKNNVAGLFQLNLAQIKNQQEVLEGTEYLKKHPEAKTSHRLYCKDGRILESHSQPQILDGKVVGRVLNYRDVTNRLAAQKKLVESEERFRGIFESSPLGILVIEDRKVPFKNVNQKFCELIGYTKEELLKLSLTDICCNDYYPKHVEEYRNHLQEGADNFSLLNRYQTKQGAYLWVRLNISIIKDDKGNITSELATVENVNDKIIQEKRINELVVQLKSLNEELEQKVKIRTMDLRQTNTELRRSNQDLEQFAYIASHDLQEPLRMVGNFVQLLERQYRNKIDQEGQEYINFIVDGVNRMSKLIQNLLKYSRVGRKESALRHVNLNKIIEAKLFGLRQKIEETNSKVKINPVPNSVYCEPDQIGMVFYNLISNAIKFNQSNPEIEIGYEDLADEILFYVKDNGIGIDIRYENKVFEIFKRLHRREDYEGTGIGLALCKKIIARHEGKIWFDSDLEKGTTFYFTISKKLQYEKHVSLDSNLVS